MELAEELFADRRPIDNRHPPDRRANGEFSRPRRRRVEPPSTVQDAAVPDGDLLPQHVAEGVDDAAFGLRRHVARLHREAGIRWWRRPTTGVGEDGVPSPAGRTCVPALQPTIRTQLGERCAAWPRTCCPHHPSRRSPQRAIVHWPRPSHTVDGGSTRRRRGWENSPSRPTIWGMTVVDRPTISEQFFGRFHAHGFPNRWKTPSIYIYFCTRPSAPVDRRGRWGGFCVEL